VAATVARMLPQLSLSAAAGCGYVIGALPSADFAARLATGDHDLRTEGTGNPGSLNTSHVLGKKWGTAVGLTDIAKGVVAASIGRRLAGAPGANVAATAAVIGHCHPPGRSGGKGVATSVGQVIGTFPSYLPIDAAVALATSQVPWFRSRTRAATTLASGVWIASATTAWRRTAGTTKPTATGMLPLGAAVSSIVIAQRFKTEAQRVDNYNHTS